MTKLIKRSPQQEVFVQEVKDGLAYESSGMHLSCPTRWTVHAAALTSISENYNVFRDTWCMAKQESSESEMRACLGGVAKQMDSFLFFFGVELGRLVISMADNLSATCKLHVSYKVQTFWQKRVKVSCR